MEIFKTNICFKLLVGQKKKLWFYFVVNEFKDFKSKFRKLISLQCFIWIVNFNETINMAIESIAWRRRSAYFSVVLLVILSANFVQTQYQQNPSKQSHITSSCSSKTTCHDCIRAKSCAWCLQPDLGDRPRCFEPEILRDYCKEEFEWDPPTEQRLVLAEKLTLKESSAAQGSAQSRAQRLAAAYVENQNTKGRYSSSNYSSQSYSSQSGYYSQGGSHMEESHTSYSHSESGRIVQIYPQRVNLKLRISMFYSFFTEKKFTWSNHPFLIHNFYGLKRRSRASTEHSLFSS